VVGGNEAAQTEHAPDSVEQDFFLGLEEVGGVFFGDGVSSDGGIAEDFDGYADGTGFTLVECQYKV
jgi:hypothetical protein